MDTKISSSDQTRPVKNPVSNGRTFFFTILVLLVTLVVFASGAYYLKTQRNKSTFVNTPPVHTTKQVQLSDANIKQKDWALKYIQKSQNDLVQDVHLINSKTNENRIIGQAYVVAPGEHAVLTKDASTVIFLEARSEGSSLDIEKVSIYSVPQNSIVKSIILRDIKTALPSLSIPRNASLNSLLLSPDEGKIAMSYGYTYELDSGSDIIVIDLANYKISSVNAKGVVKAWKDNNTLLYQVVEYTTKKDYTNIVTKEVSIR